jgi:eukaryotic-like serine/threonine-protein kinase
MTEPATPTNLPPTRAFTPAANPPTVQVKVAVADRGEGQPTTDIQVLLRKRLRGGGLIGTGAFVFFVIAQSLALFQEPGLSLSHWLLTAEFWIMLVILAVLTGILWTKRPLSLVRLRRIETVLVGAVLAHVALIVWLDLHFGSSLVGALAESHAHDGRPVSYWAFPFFVLIVGYGTLFPNTGRRCLLVVGTMALTPLTLLAVTGLSMGATLTGNLGFLLGYLAMYMAVAVAIATYGSHRIEVLRAEASNARRLGQYQLKQRLGSGGMGEVYLAEHLLLRRPCAIKLIRPDRAMDPNNLLRFEREVEATATLTHPNTVQIFDYGRAEDGTFYYAMEYLPGLSLQGLVERHGPLPAERTIYLLRQVCGALREAHAIGLIHRDIKPTNILVCARGGFHDVVKLVDFGLVRAPEAGPQDGKLTQEGSLLGTPAYMSPEQAGGAANLDPRSDIYSLGAVAYFLVTGVLPFKASSAMHMLAAHLYEPVKPPRSVRPELPADLEAVILCCLEKDPAKRYADAESLDQALAQCRCAGDWNWRQAAEWWHAHGE